jgi:hypothetical protein
MNTYIKSFDSINESIKQHGIVLIKGKPRGKNGEQMLYATHVNNWAELRPGATMLFLSDTFYRIIKDGDHIKGVKINWKDEDSLKASLNLKSPGKISIVRNNNKTPYHWKTLKHTSLVDALNSVKGDLLGSDYILESTTSSESLIKTVLTDALDSIFREGKNVIVLDWDIPTDTLANSVTDKDDRSGECEWEATFDCLYIGRPELDTQVAENNLQRFELTLYFNSEFSVYSWYDPGDYMNPPDGDTEISDISTTLDSIIIDGEEFSDTFGITEIVTDIDDDGLESFIKKKHSQFI